MIYDNVEKGIFRSRPNRFIAIVEVNGKDEVCHVKNTGRCRELLINGTEVILQKSSNQKRKTKYDLISVYKNGILINMDSQAPNKVFYEWALKGNFLPDIGLIKPEFTYGKSRFDFYIETGKEKIFVEVKGVTLEKDGVAMFPDAPTECGVKHVNALAECIKAGYKAYVIFVVQMEKAEYFTPNRETHEEFADALINACKSGVKIMALSCKVEENCLVIEDTLQVKLEK